MNIGVAPRALFRLEMKEALRSRWLTFTAVVYALLFAAFVWLGLRESEVLGFTGLSRVVLNMANAVALAVPLVALVATTACIPRARQSGLFELVLAQPVRRRDWFVAVLGARLLVVLGPLVVLFLGALAFGTLLDDGDRALAPMVVRSLAVSAALGWAFVGIGLWASSAARTPERATVLALVAWIATSALHDFALVGALLRVRMPPGLVFALAAANPAEGARLAVLSGVDPELSVLGPVGFWLANTLGPRLTLVVGIGWPALLGAFALACAERRFAHSDLVG